MSGSNQLKALILKSINSSAVTGSYAPINPNGLEHPCSILRVINTSDKDAFISFDGTNDSDIVLSRGAIQIPGQAANQPNNHVSLFSKGTVIYVKGLAGTGTISVGGYYQY